MKELAAFVLIAAILCVQANQEDEIDRQWKEYREQYKKTYRSPVEESTRYAIFKHNLYEITDHNKLFNEGKIGYKKGINEFTDWTQEEFKEYVSHGLISERNIISSFTDETDEIQKAWQAFQVNYRKSYKSPIVSKKRFQIFKNNYIKMVEHNELYDQELVSDLLGINQFSDWTQEEFRDFVNKGLIPSDDDDDILQRWNEFKQKFNKTYKSITETENRFNIFKHNVWAIDEHNLLYKQGKSTYWMGINRFTDWTNEEYKEWVRTH